MHQVGTERRVLYSSTLQCQVHCKHLNLDIGIMLMVFVVTFDQYLLLLRKVCISYVQLFQLVECRQCLCCPTDTPQQRYFDGYSIIRASIEARAVGGNLKR